MRNGIIAISLWNHSSFVGRLQCASCERAFLHMCAVFYVTCVLYNFHSVNYVRWEFEMQFAITASIQLSICCDSNGMPLVVFVYLFVCLFVVACARNAYLYPHKQDILKCNGGNVLLISCMCCRFVFNLLFCCHTIFVRDILPGITPNAANAIALHNFTIVEYVKLKLGGSIEKLNCFLNHYECCYLFSCVKKYKMYLKLQKYIQKQCFEGGILGAGDAKKKANAIRLDRFKSWMAFDEKLCK